MAEELTSETFLQGYHGSHINKHTLTHKKLVDIFGALLYYIIIILTPVLNAF